jgi:hypothetical protein
VQIYRRCIGEPRRSAATSFLRLEFGERGPKGSDDVIVGDIVPGSRKCKQRPAVMKGVGFTVLCAVAGVVCGAGKNVLMIAVRIRLPLFMCSDIARNIPTKIRSYTLRTL